MKKDYTIIDKKELFDYLDGYVFVDDIEIQSCICDFIENQEGNLFYSDCELAYNLMKEYKKHIINDFNNLVENLSK